MKRKFGLIVITLSFILGLFSCTNNDTPSDDNKLYSVTYEQSNYYIYDGTVNATSGQKANVSLTSNFPAYEIIGCTYNGNPCTVEPDNNETKKYSFIMPSSNVEIKVQAKWNDVDTSGYRNFLSFDSSNVYTVKSAKNDVDYNNDQYWGEPLIIVFNTDVSYMTLADITCFSVDEEVLPNNAIEVNKTLASNSNSIIGGKIIIDRSKASVGKTQIVLRVKNNNSLSYDGIIVTTITFTE